MAVNWFKIFAVTTFVAILLIMGGIVAFCIYQGDYQGAVGWFICWGIVATPCRWDPAFWLKGYRN